MAHVNEDWNTLTEQWRQGFTLGQSDGWSEAVGLGLPMCSLDAIAWEKRKIRCGEKEWAGREGEVV